MKMKKNRTEIELTQSERMLFALLKAALNESPAEAELFEEASDEEWLACYQLAVKQGVMALAWDGLCTLPPDLHPERPLRLTWGLGVSAQEERYHRYARTASELTEFYAKSGIRTVLLKGVGFAACYPIPAHREGGDIDIFTYSDGTWSWSDAQANNFADLLMEAQGIKVDRKHSVKHSMFPYQDIPVENHKRFVNVETYAVAKQVDPLCRRLLSPRRILLEGEYAVYVPSADFNTLLLAFHAAQHYRNGLALHHLCDWACLLRSSGLHVPGGIDDKRFANWITALTHLCHTYLGTEPEASGQEALADSILREVLRPPYPSFVPTTHKLGIISFKLRRMWHQYRLCRTVLYVPFYRWISTSVVSHLRFPETVFDRGRK